VAVSNALYGLPVFAEGSEWVRMLIGVVGVGALGLRGLKTADKLPPHASTNTSETINNMQEHKRDNRKWGVPIGVMETSILICLSAY
jgi:hypothetical protein